MCALYSSKPVLYAGVVFGQFSIYNMHVLATQIIHVSCFVFIMVSTCNLLQLCSLFAHVYSMTYS